MRSVLYFRRKKKVNVTEMGGACQQIASPSALHLIYRLWHTLSPHRRRQFCVLLVIMLTTAFSEILSLGAVLPFVGIITEPERLFNLQVLAPAVRLLGIESSDQLIFPITVAFVCAVMLAGALRVGLLRLSTRLAHATGADISLEVYKRTLYQPYQVHIARNSSEVISGITIKANNVTQVFTSILALLTSSVMLMAIMGTLIAIDPVVSISACFGFGLSYISITWISRRWLQGNSERIAAEQTKVIKALQEGLGGIRDVLLDSSQMVYCSAYQNSDKPLRAAQARNQFISACPRYAMEAVGMSLLAILACSLSFESGKLNSALPMLGALALGAQRLLPTLQQIYASWAIILGDRCSLINVLDLLEQPLPRESGRYLAKRQPFEKSISLENIQFQYSPNTPLVLDNFTLQIAKSSRIGIVGKTGSGKSTALDILMGLLTPSRGQLKVDGVVIQGENISAWQKNIAHVPQSIFLADTTLAENIAFGIPYENIDFTKVQEAARQAQIADFIESRPEQYNAIVGERGVRLSGGQRQRIGIARALYKQASVLVFDEATSALDTDTEKEVMKAIDGLNRELTIIIVAHRLSTVSHCDIIVEFEQGNVRGLGSYQELIERGNSNAKTVELAI